MQSVGKQVNLTEDRAANDARQIKYTMHERTAIMHCIALDIDMLFALCFIFILYFWFAI